jgi:hypothetical protein
MLSTTPRINLWRTWLAVNNTVTYIAEHRKLREEANKEAAKKVQEKAAENKRMRLSFEFKFKSLPLVEPVVCVPNGLGY